MSGPESRGDKTRLQPGMCFNGDLVIAIYGNFRSSQ
jgi:hypothetical protein